MTPDWDLVAIGGTTPQTEMPLYWCRPHWGCQQVVEVSLGEACAKLLPRSPGKSLQSQTRCSGNPRLWPWKTGRTGRRLIVCIFMHTYVGAFFYRDVSSVCATKCAPETHVRTVAGEDEVWLTLTLCD